MRLLTRYMHLLVLLIAMRRLFIIYRSLDRLGERLCMHAAATGEKMEFVQ